MDAEALVTAVRELEPDAQGREDSDKPAVSVPLGRLFALLKQLRARSEFAFDFLATHTAVDWPEEEKFEVVYILYSTRHGHWLVVTSDVSREAPVVPTVHALWPIAEWQEREVYDMFGIEYDNHPDLRRIFLDDDWKGFPLRKDYDDPYMLDLPNER